MTTQQPVDETIQALVNGRRWWHRIEVAPGIVTPGRDDTPRRAAILDLPASFDGLRVLDVGALDGYFSFLAEQRGARDVVAFDQRGPDDSGFATARRLLGSRVEHVQGSAYAISAEWLGRFDVVLCLGLLYHLRHPLLALEHLHDVTREGGILYVESHVAMRRLAAPLGPDAEGEIGPLLRASTLAEFLPRDELASDLTNWWAPSIPCLTAWLDTHGFEPTLLSTLPGRASWRCVRRPGPLPPWVLTQ